MKRRNKHVNNLASHGQKTYNKDIGESMDDEAVNSPSHYNQTELECIDAIRYALGAEGFVAYCKGNALKYTWRSGHKINSEEDLKKAAWYCRMAAGDDPRKDPGYDRKAPIKDLQVDLTDLSKPKPGTVWIQCGCRSCIGLSSTPCPFQPHPEDYEQAYVDPKEG
jgi:hypothetical protein